MIKRIFSLALCILLLCFSFPSALAEEENVLSISTPGQLLEFAENCRLDSYSRGLTVRLENDIDLSGTDFFSIPSFSGSFDGNGHSIKGFKLTADGSVQGLFRYITEGASVRNLSVQGHIEPGGSRASIGGIAGSNSGLILNCSFDGSVIGGDKIGGIVGENAVSGIIEGCKVSGSVSGLHFSGGIAGVNDGVIRLCENKASINTSEQENIVDLNALSVDSLIGSESATTATDIGGIAGLSRGLIRSSVNIGDVGYKSMGYNVGGIAGSQVGYIIACENRGNINGRKEVGGIVGQLEPAANIDYTQDTLQILQGQLDAMGGTVNSASASVQNAGSEMGAYMSQLESQTGTALEAVDILRNPQDYDPDVVQAAQGTLTDSLNEMGGTVQLMGNSAIGAMNSISAAMSALQAQIGAMSSTIGEAEENLGLDFTDVSDFDTPDAITAKVELSVNHGSVSGDSNTGGIIGAISVANDFDSYENTSFSGTQSYNISGELRAVTLLCVNRGEVTAKKQNGGGIVGLQTMGLVRSCMSFGTVNSSAADYVGGITGLSQGFIRACGANCRVVGDSSVGGIAGSAAIVSECIGLVRVEGREKLGEVLGSRQPSEEENPIRFNYYLSEQDKGAIDGISYEGQAQPLDLDSFLALEALPEEFRQVEIDFVDENGNTQTVSVPLGGSLADIPQVPEKADHAGRWAGLSEVSLDSILFGMSFEAEYVGENAVIESSQKRESGVSIMLLQGSFSSKAELKLEEISGGPALPANEKLVECWSFSMSEGETVSTMRYHIPEDCETENARLMVRTAQGWMEVQTDVHGSYLVFGTDGSFDAICLKLVPSNLLSMVSKAGGITLASIVVLVTVLAIYISSLKKKRG